MRRVETGESYVGEVALDLFQGEAFKRQLYLDRATALVFEGIDILKVTKEEPIHICTGYILSKARQALMSEGFTVISKRIGGETQSLAERGFIRSLVRLGAGDEATLSRMRSFNDLVRWVLEDLDGRERFVKTGWKSWSRLKKGEGRD